jgi:hypothetical protein
MFYFSINGERWSCVRSQWAPRRRCWTATLTGTSRQIHAATKDTLITAIREDNGWRVRARERHMREVLASAVVTHSA